MSDRSNLCHKPICVKIEKIEKKPKHIIFIEVGINLDVYLCILSLYKIVKESTHKNVEFFSSWKFSAFRNFYGLEKPFAKNI